MINSSERVKVITTYDGRLLTKKMIMKNPHIRSKMPSTTAVLKQYQQCVSDGRYYLIFVSEYGIAAHVVPITDMAP